MTTIEKTSRRDQMFALIEQQKQSDKANKIFCEQHGIALSCFYYWQKKYRQEQTGSGGFVPVLVRRCSPAISQAVEINYPNGVLVRVPAGSSQALLKTLIGLM